MGDRSVCWIHVEMARHECAVSVEMELMPHAPGYRTMHGRSGISPGRCGTGMRSRRMPQACSLRLVGPAARREAWSATPRAEAPSMMHRVPIDRRVDRVVAARLEMIELYDTSTSAQR